MNIVARLFGSTLGKKYIMAVSGAAMVLFVTGHMIGNLQLFLGPEALNRYAHFLQSNKEMLWLVRIGLLVMVGLHVWAALKLSVENKAARPIEYGHGKPPVAASLASRIMMVGGSIIALFIVFHILHYTVCAQAVNFIGVDFKTLTDTNGNHDVFAMMVYGFGRDAWFVSVFYVIAVGFLSMHLSHGIAAMFQSLGLRNHTWWPAISQGAKIWAVVLFLGYAVVPAAVLGGFGKCHLAGVTAKCCAMPRPAVATTTNAPAASTNVTTEAK